MERATKVGRTCITRISETSEETEDKWGNVNPKVSWGSSTEQEEMEVVCEYEVTLTTEVSMGNETVIVVTLEK